MPRAGAADADALAPPWPAGDVAQLLRRVESFGVPTTLPSPSLPRLPARRDGGGRGGVAAAAEEDAGAEDDDGGAPSPPPRRRKLQKREWKTLAAQLEADYFYSWTDCFRKYSDICDAREAAAARAATRRRGARRRARAAARRAAEEAQARAMWRRGEPRRRDAADAEDAALVDRFRLRRPVKLLAALQQKPTGRRSALRGIVAGKHAEAVDAAAWTTDEAQAFGRAWLWGYGVVSDVDTEVHYDGGGRFGGLAARVRAALRRWELEPRSTRRGPTLPDEGQLLLGLARECAARHKQAIVEEDTDAEDCADEPRATQREQKQVELPQKNERKGEGALARATRMFGAQHPVVVNLLSMSLALRLRVLERETALSTLRGDDGDGGFDYLADMMAATHVNKMGGHDSADEGGGGKHNDDSSGGSKQGNESADGKIEAHRRPPEPELELSRNSALHPSNIPSCATFDAAEREITTFHEDFVSSACVDPVRYSPSARRERLVRSLVHDADAAVATARSLSYRVADESEQPPREDTCGAVAAGAVAAGAGAGAATAVAAPESHDSDVNLLAQALLKQALALAVAGEHWGLGTFQREHATVVSTAGSLVGYCLSGAAQAVTVRLTARNKRAAANAAWHAEHNRLKNLDETELRRERARLRQEYRRHKKRGRPGRIEMLSCKAQLDVLKLDLDHATGKVWHPEHAFVPPELETPRPPRTRKRTPLPPGWVEVTPGGTLSMHADPPPYYVHEDTGKVTRHAPSVSSVAGEDKVPEVGDTIGDDEEADDEGGDGEDGGDADSDSINEGERHPTQNGIAAAESVVWVDPAEVDTQHRPYFAEACAAARESRRLFADTESPCEFQALAVLARVCSAACLVADSEGNAATRMDVQASELANIAVDSMTEARRLAAAAGLRWTLEYADLLTRSAQMSAYRRKDGDMSDGAEYLKRALAIYAALGFEDEDWHVLETQEQYVALLDFDGYSD